MDMTLYVGNLGLKEVPRKRQEKNIFTRLDLNELLVLLKKWRDPQRDSAGYSGHKATKLRGNVSFYRL